MCQTMMPYKQFNRNIFALCGTIVIKGSKKTSMLCAKSTTCSAQLPELLTVRNSQKQKQTIAKAAGLCTPFNDEVISK